MLSLENFKFEEVKLKVAVNGADEKISFFEKIVVRDDFIYQGRILLHMFFANHQIFMFYICNGKF